MYYLCSKKQPQTSPQHLMGRRKLSTKGLRDKLRAKKRVATIKQISAQPVLKNVDVAVVATEFEKKLSTRAEKRTETTAKEKISTKPKATDQISTKATTTAKATSQPSTTQKKKPSTAKKSSSTKESNKSKQKSTK